MVSHSRSRPVEPLNAGEGDVGFENEGRHSRGPLRPPRPLRRVSAQGRLLAQRWGGAFRPRGHLRSVR